MTPTTGRVMKFRPRLTCRLTTDAMAVVDAARALVAEGFAEAHDPACRCAGCRLRIAVRRMDPTPVGCAA